MFPHAVDSTIIAAFRSCPRKCYLQYIEHWKPKDQSIHLIAGGAFASAVERARVVYFKKGGSRDDAAAEGLRVLWETYGWAEAPEGSAKSWDRLAGAFEFYLATYPLGKDGAIPIKVGASVEGIEFSFANPLDVKHPKTLQPILYTGRSDLVAQFAGGVYIFDEKTASQLGASWGYQWDLRSQFTGYCWGCQQAGIDVAGIIVRGIGILKTKYSTEQVITYRSDYEINRWYNQVHHDIERMKQCYAMDYWDYNLDHSCNEYGGCPFRSVCKSSEPESWLNTYFEKRVWDPMQRKEISIPEYKAFWGETV